jgi:hypothetical protein
MCHSTAARNEPLSTHVSASWSFYISLAVVTLAAVLAAVLVHGALFGLLYHSALQNTFRVLRSILSRRQIGGRKKIKKKREEKNRAARLWFDG